MNFGDLDKHDAGY